MHITRLRLIGFKSFVEPTDLLIEPGLTGVVGPNGCGKSNLLEALRWAMGEASHKSMRAAAMDDVIFAGTTARPARNHASVTLFIDNSSRRAPAEFNGSDSLEITRHIEREAGSAYRINGREARARDVKILFEDAATGARSPALVRQGQIAEIVNAKPEQRRRILEDAAGTAGLSSRRHDAELRLRAAEANLARVADVLGGLTAQIVAVKRQQRAAKRYLEITNEIKALEAVALFLGWQAAHADVVSEEGSLADALGMLAVAADGEARATVAEAAAAARLPALRDHEVGQAASLQRLRGEADRLDRDEARVRERQAELTAAVAQLEADLQREIARVTEAGAAEAALRDEGARLSAEGEAARRDALGQGAALESARAAEAGASAALGALTIELADRRAERQRLESQMADEQRRLARVENQRSEAVRLLRELEQNRTTSGADELSTQLQQTEATLAAWEERLVAAERDVGSTRGAEDRARGVASERRMGAVKLKAERDTLRRLMAPPKDARFVPVLDGLKVARGYERALGAALGEDLDAPVDPAAPIHWRPTEVSDTDPSLPEGAEPLAARVKGGAALNRRLRQVGVVSRADAPRLRAGLQPGQRLVSRDGDLWRWDGYTAAAEAPSAAARRLEQRNRLEEVEAALEEADNAASEAAEAFAVVAAGREAAEVAARDAKQALSRSRHDHATQAEQLARLQKLEREREAKSILLSESHRQAETVIAEHLERVSLLAQDLAGLPDLEAMNADHKGKQAQAQLLRAETSRAELAVASLATRLQHLDQRQSAIAVDLRRWRDRAIASEAQIDALGARKSDAARQLSQMADVPEQIAVARARLTDEIVSLELARQAAADALALAETQFREAATVLRAVQAEHASARETKARIETRLESARERRSSEARRIREVLDCAPEECLTVAGVEPSAALPNADAAARRLQSLRQDRERLGGVNLSAEEELLALETQFAALEADKTDLEGAIAQLRQGIGKLTREGRKRLNDAFEQVNGHFQRLFTTLFNGGEARLEMIEDPEDPLAGGLEIIAKPPGKKPATLSLLSGGEQTLTALSLIFAVFLTNPSPICVLDEVDAPLDDSNVDRFCTLMDEMSRTTETRFLVITHHPMTMSRMDRLFGVTMAEKGISQLVSVDLATAEQYREAG